MVNAMRAPGEDLWVFGYGSLMWRPGFAFEERQVARLSGFHRSLCVYSHVHRGTPDKPGLVMGLDRGGSCKGLAYRVHHARAPETIAYLREREQVTSVYVERIVPITLQGGMRRLALTYSVDSSHAQYAGRLDRERLLHHVTQGHGVSGPNPDYVLRTHDQLLDLGLQDPVLSWLARALRHDTPRR
ncbi:MAG: gamma-glutamylcyclotransferase [Beijerinckiaceae bacterium]|jgi:cation transport protein ChaC|nr:gamma-glutamylcyclotransferase [Beijerinckiaceae bacterium]